MESNRYLMNNDLIESPDINITYSDDDLLVIDSIKGMLEKQTLRIGMNLIAICLKGKVQFEVKNKTMTLSERQFIVFPPGTVIDNPMSSPDYECRFLCLTNSIVNNLLLPHIKIWNQSMYANELTIREMSAIDVERVTIFFNLLKMTLETSYTNNRYRTEIIHSLLRVGLLELTSTLERSMKGQPGEKRQSDSLFHQFIDLLHNDNCTYYKVNHYAKQLCISSKYLTQICMKNSGKSAKQWINETMAENVRFYLKSTDKPIKEIAFILGFPSPSYLARYVKKNFGATPLEIRG